MFIVARDKGAAYATKGFQRWDPSSFRTGSYWGFMLLFSAVHSSSCIYVLDELSRFDLVKRRLRSDELDRYELDDSWMDVTQR